MTRSGLGNEISVILNEIPLNVKLDEVKSRFLDSAMAGFKKAENLVQQYHCTKQILRPTNDGYCVWDSE